MLWWWVASENWISPEAAAGHSSWPVSSPSCKQTANWAWAQRDRQLSRSCSKSLLSAGWEGGSSGYGSNWGNCVSLSILVVMLKNQVAPHQLQAQLHLGRSSKFSFWNESKIWLQIFDVPQPSVWFGQRINAKMGFQWWSGCVCVCVCVWEHQGNLVTWKLFKAVFTALTGIGVGVDWRYCKLGSPLYGGRQW